GGNLPAALPGIDLAAGLAQTMGDEKFYRSMLVMFHDCQRDFGASFRAARTGADATAPERLAHTLKGSAGTICAWSLYAAAGELEQACREGADDAQVDRLLDKTLAELAPVVDGLAALGTAPTHAPVAQPAGQAMDPAQVRAVTEQLEALLSYGDSTVGAVLDTHAGLLAAAYPDHYRQIDNAVKAFDFDEALAQLRAAVATAT
ncbi:MAG: Hpt domain-containing protein, partial [Rhodoferax sp.]